jgi:hypothetical protein
MKSYKPAAEQQNSSFYQSMKNIFGSNSSKITPTNT